VIIDTSDDCDIVETSDDTSDAAETQDTANVTNKFAFYGAENFQMLMIFV